MFCWQTAGLKAKEMKPGAADGINRFLGGVDLAGYRAKYSRIKLVELDMPRAVQPISFLYREYWQRRENYPRFEDFYRMYSGELEAQLEEFRRETMFSRETFCRGLPARIYRTWASLLTQIQGGYAAEDIYGAGGVEMSAALDYRGIDMKINDGKRVVNIQIKKETMSREVRAPWHGLKKGVPIVNLTYEVPGCDPLKKDGEERVPYTRWREKWEGKLARLDNGFIIFLPAMFARENITVP